MAKRGLTDKWNKEKVCMSSGCLSKQELGGVVSWPLRARTSQSPSAKQQQTGQLTVGHKPPLWLPWKQTDKLPPPLFLYPLVYHPQGQGVSPLKVAAGESRGCSYHLSDMICLECGNALLYVNRHVCDVRYNNGQMTDWLLPTAAWSKPTGIKLFTVRHCRYCMIHIVHKPYDSYSTCMNHGVDILCICQHWKS